MTWLFMQNGMLSTKFRFATEEDVDLYFDWANDTTVRSQSYQSKPIVYEDHVRWFKSKLKDSNYTFLLFYVGSEKETPIGQVRLQSESSNKYIISVSVDEKFRGKGYASTILTQATNWLLERNPKAIINAYIKSTNPASVKAFIKSGFKFKEQLVFQEIESYLYVKTK